MNINVMHAYAILLSTNKNEIEKKELIVITEENDKIPSLAFNNLTLCTDVNRLISTQCHEQQYFEGCILTMNVS